MRFRSVALAVLAVLTCCAPALAAPVCASFGFFPADFGGSGIPNHAVCSATIQDGQNTITLALTATQRYANPAVTNDGAGTFYAETGADTLNGQPTYFKWNWDWFVSSTGGDYFVELLYDFDPGAATAEASLGKISFSTTGPALAEDSWNLGMSFLDQVLPGVTPPVFPSPDPNAVGEYSFVALVRNAAGAELLRSEILVNTQAVPEPTSMVLLGTGLVGFVAHRRRRITRAELS